MVTPSVEQLLHAIANVVESDPQWRVVSTTATIVRAIPKQLEEILPSLGSSRGAPGSAWLTLDFWCPPKESRLGVFWRANSVHDPESRNLALEALLGAPGRTGFEYRGKPGAWRKNAEPAFAGETISARWWPRGSGPSIPAARDDIRVRLETWSRRVPMMAQVVEAALKAGGSSGPASPPTPNVSHARPRDAAQPRRVAKERRPSATTPPIPRDIREFRYPPHYVSIFEIYPEETHLYGTEDLYGDWNAEVLFLAKDAGSSKNFLPAAQGGDGWAWVHNPSRPTNRNLVPLAEQLPCAKLYASFLSCLLRNDAKESGPLLIDDKVRAFVKRVLIWTIENMHCLRSVAVLGHDAWRETMRGLGYAAEAPHWKERHRSGAPFSAHLAGRQIEFFALNHPARIPAAQLMRQHGWKRLLARHAAET